MIPHRPSDSEHQILQFRRGKAGPRLRPPKEDDFAKYTRGEPDDYRHRMVVNAVGFVFVLGLIGAALWLAESMAELRRNQDCALSGRVNCIPIEVNKSRF